MGSIAKNSYVVFNYTLTNDEGKVLSSSEPHGPINYVHGMGMLVPGLEKAMEGKNIGEGFNVKLNPEEGYGVRRDDLVHILPRDNFDFSGKIETGMQFQADTPSGRVLNLTVTSVTDNSITVDANHPFAGMNLNFKVSIVECRQATDEELKDLNDTTCSDKDCSDKDCGGCGSHGGHGHGGHGGHGGCGC